MWVHFLAIIVIDMHYDSVDGGKAVTKSSDKTFRSFLNKRYCRLSVILPKKVIFLLFLVRIELITIALTVIRSTTHI